MTGEAAVPTSTPADLLAVQALESGNWRSALGVLGSGQVADAYLGANLRTVARAMGFRAAGDHGQAWDALGKAAAGMVRRQPGLPQLPSGDGVRLALPPEYPGLGYRALRLIWREQGELSRLRRQAAHRPNGMTPDRYMLVLAFVEYLCWVELDLETTLLPPDQHVVLRDRRRDGFLASATSLRRLHNPAAGDMTRAVWDRADQYHGLRRLAMLELAARGAPPWTEVAAPEGCPVRNGARIAWTMAQAS
ncbi:hypothetical protein AB0E69_14685 [Kribbella sp. NPDC026611]|uniref:hypothetical protein n=1 Tax=Kribbella sp. NPDC026611 TaxID=3154911 RepID=UPI0033DACA53